MRDDGWFICKGPDRTYKDGGPRLPETVFHTQMDRKMAEAIVAAHNAGIPRCDLCKHWGGFPDGNGRDQCTNHNISPHQNDEFMTTADFGCVQWEAK